MTNANPNWIVRVYAHESATEPCAKWLIENRTEREAEREASADIRAEFGDDADWTLTPEGDE